MISERVIKIVYQEINLILIYVYIYIYMGFK